MLVPHFIENIFRSGLTLVSSSDMITIKIDNKKTLKTTRKLTNKKDYLKNLKGQSNGKRETNSDHEMGKR